MTSIAKLITATGEKMRHDFAEISTQASHMGERGRAREDVVRDFLGKYLPDRVGVGQGVIIDHAGVVSHECDIVLFDRQSTPVFWLSDTVRIFPAETVFLVVQVKSNLRKGELKAALDNIASVTRLASSPEPHRPMLAGYALSGLFHSNVFRLNYKRTAVQGAIFAYDSPSLRTLVDNVADALAARPRREWPLFVVSLGKGSILYGREKPGGHDLASPLGADSLAGISAEDISPLISLYFMIMYLIQVTLVAVPNLSAHLALGETKAIWSPLGHSENGVTA